MREVSSFGYDSSNRENGTVQEVKADAGLDDFKRHPAGSLEVVARRALVTIWRRAEAKSRRLDPLRMLEHVGSIVMDLVLLEDSRVEREIRRTKKWASRAADILQMWKDRGWATPRAHWDGRPSGAITIRADADYQSREWLEINGTPMD